MPTPLLELGKFLIAYFCEFQDAMQRPSFELLMAGNNCHNLLAASLLNKDDVAASLTFHVKAESIAKNLDTILPRKHSKQDWHGPRPQK